MNHEKTALQINAQVSDKNKLQELLEDLTNLEANYDLQLTISYFSEDQFSPELH